MGATLRDLVAFVNLRKPFRLPDISTDSVPLKPIVLSGEPEFVQWAVSGDPESTRASFILLSACFSTWRTRSRLIP